MEAFDLRVRNAVYGAFVRDGRAPDVPGTAAELGAGEAEVAAAYGRLHEAHALVLDPGDPPRIRMLNPFSAVETPHRVEAAGRDWFANCAWDALGIPAALGVDAVVRSACADCGEGLRLEVRDGELVEGHDLLVHFAVPARSWWDDIGFT